MALRSRTSPSRGDGRLSVRQAVALGLIQGPAELLPVSSSGHLVLVPALLGWPYARLPADVRKAFEVALHTGAGIALGLLLRDDVLAAANDLIGTTLLAGPAAAIAFVLEDEIEQKASGARIAATAQIAAGLALAAADARSSRRSDARTIDRLVIGAAQVMALVPGVSRNGATVTAARALGFDRETAARLSWRAGLPIIGGATVLKVTRLAQRELAPELRVPFAAGAAAAFASTLVAAPLLRVRRHRVAAAYRIALGAIALRRLDQLQWPHG
ncbi:MAG TPA: undecaprenyl-diphosphate phosphatase [Thermoleophilaceae bacterium]|jgi:undecaprenyl-diphosphatase|nr:undecaprenyl-diphosphate phosphatase [Thermoleophilaceae bacterium]